MNHCFSTLKTVLTRYSYQLQHYIFLLFVSILILFLPLLEPNSTGGDGDGDDDLADQYMRYVLVRSRHFRTFLLSDP